MSPHAEALRLQLTRHGPRAGLQLFESIGISQPTGSRALRALGDEVVRIGAGRTIQYALRDTARGLPDIAVHRVDGEGRIHHLGVLIAVHPAGFVMRHATGAATYSEGLPWWLFDMRPQGYLGRAYAARHGLELGLPARLGDWSDAHALRALLSHGDDAVGDLLLGDAAQQRWLARAAPLAIAADRQAEHYVEQARQAMLGETPGSSAGGEQPKFTTFVATPHGLRHVIVKFSEVAAGAVGERWRDLLLAEHLALTTLREGGVPAAVSDLVDHGDQRFLVVERFDRSGPLGRRGLVSLSALDAEFVGAGSGGWPLIVARLRDAGLIHPDAASAAARLWAFGSLIGNTDMHADNLSFFVGPDFAAPYELAPAYDMTPMAFAPRSGGSLPDTLADANIRADVPASVWREVARLADDFLRRARATSAFSPAFVPCLAALERHLADALGKIDRLG